MADKKVSFFRDFSAIAEKVNLSAILEAIKYGAYKDKIEELRNMEGNVDKYRELKKQLPHFTPSGIFYKKRRADHLLEYSQVIVLDIDKIGADKATLLSNRASEIPYTLSAFVSPSGTGVKILVCVDSDAEMHLTAFSQIVEFYSNELSVEVDSSGKDVSRTCFVSNDADLIFNKDVEAFRVVTATEKPEFLQQSISSGSENFQYVIDFTDKLCAYYPGNRNNYIYTLANNFNRAGVSKSIAESFIRAQYPDIANEVPDTVKSAYSHASEYGSLSIEYMYSASSAKNADTANRANVKTPIIPEEIHHTLPELLKHCVDAMELRREKDILLTGTLTVLSGCFSYVYGLYDKKEVYANLNSFIIGPPTGGKGNVNFARDLAMPIHKEIRNVYELNKNYQGEDVKKDLAISLFIPADSSSAAVKESLSFNQGVGIICESEADTLSSTFKQDWGGYSELLRKAFHHEPILYSRVGKDEPVKFREISNPRVSVCLTGTPNQVSNLLKSSEDGLFSRFLYYTFKHEGVPFFKDVFSEEGIENKTEYFESLSKIVLKNFCQMKDKGKIRFKYTEDQNQRFVEHFNTMMKKIFIEFGEESDNLGTVKRLGLMVFRIAMVLSIVRNFDKEEFPDELICREVDFVNSLKLSDIFLEHALTVYKTLPEAVSIKDNAKNLYLFLPEAFEAKEAIKIGKMICGFAERSVSNYLSELSSIGWLQQKKRNGPYFKKNLQ